MQEAQQTISAGAVPALERFVPPLELKLTFTSIFV
jgi:hypothetical protein